MQLIADNLRIERGGRILLDQLSVKVSAGEALLVTGPNGTGKTSLLRTIAGFSPPAVGTIRLDGGDAEAELMEQCHYVGHRDGVKAALTVSENAAFWESFLGGGGGVTRALDRVGLGQLAHVPAGYLSAGQRRRLGLSRLILAIRPVWILDEPTVSLDAQGSAMLAALVDEHVAAGGIALAATHLPLGLAHARELKLRSRAAA